MDTNGITSWTLNKATNTLTVTLAAATTNLAITFSVQSIMNPTYAKTTESLTIQSLTSANVQIDISDGTFTLTPDPGALEVTLASATGVVGATDTLTFSLTLTNAIGSTGKIHILLPKWNPDSPTPQSIFSTTTPTCSSITNVSLILCTASYNVDSNNSQDKILVTGSFTATATTIVFSISNYRNPPSTEPMTTMQIYTSTDTEANIIDRDSSISLTMTTAATLSSTAITVTPSDTEINQSTVYTFSIRVSMPIPSGSRMKVTFPSEISPTSTTVSALGSGKLNTLISTSYSSATRVLTMTDIITSSTNYVNIGDIITFTLSPITNSASTAASSSFSIETIDGVDYSIEKATTGITVTATPGDITTFTVSPDNAKIRERTFYTFTFVTTNTISVGSSLTITFPSDISIENRSGTTWIDSITTISSAATWTVTGNSLLVISGGFPTSAAAGGVSISFTVTSIDNGNTVKPTGTFAAYFSTASGNKIDEYKNSDVTLTFVVNTISDFVATPTSAFTGVETKYTITLTIAPDKTILQNSYIEIVFPSAITIGDTTSSASSWAKVSGYPSDITCAFTSSDTLKISDGFASSSFAGGSLVMTIEGIRNPRSTASTLSFKVYVKDSSDYGQYAIESGEGLTISSVSDFTNVLIERDSTVNGVVTTYYFTITLSNIIYSNDYIQIVFPSSISLSSVVNQWVGITNLESSLIWNLNGNTIFITVALLSGVSQLPTTAGDTTTNIKFSISNVRNALSLAATSSFQIYVLTSNQNNRVNQKTSGLTLTNTEAATITNAAAYPIDSGLGATTSYLISFKPPNTIEQNSQIKVTIPSQIGIDTSSTMTCTRNLVIESTLACTYDSGTRTVTVTNGFATKSYVSSQVEFKISNLINPSTAMTTDSFVIQMLSSAGSLYSSISSGVTYTKEWNSPWKTWETDLSTCTSWYASSSYPYLTSGTWVTSCPAGEYDVSNVCYECQSPWATCEKSATTCLSCTSNPQLYLYKSGWVSEWPNLYEVSEDGVSWEKVGEVIVPFIPLSLWLIWVIVISITKWVRKETMFLSTLISATSYFVFLLIFIIIILFFRDSHYQSGSLTLLSFLIQITLNLIWTYFVYSKEIRKDILYWVWSEVFVKTEKFIYISSYIFSFQWLRTSFCQFANSARFDASIRMSDLMFIKLNRFSLLQILLVLLPVVWSCIYNLFWTRYLRQVFWHDIELLIIWLVLIAIIILDVWMKDESALKERYVDKKEFSKNIDITNKSLMNQTIFTTKEDLLTGRQFKKDRFFGEKQTENDMLKQAVYNKFGTILYKDNFNQNIGDFNRLIHEEKDEEVNSQISGTMMPNKSTKAFNPFTKKYDDLSNYKLMNSASRLEGNSVDYMSNTLNYARASPERSRGHGSRIEESKYDHSGSTGNISDSNDHSINDTEVQNADLAVVGNHRSRREMMRTAQQSHLPQFIVEVESAAVIKARNTLSQEMENKKKLEEIQIQLDRDLRALNKEITELEKEKFKLKLQRNAYDASSNVSGDHKLRRDIETDWAGTQYIRSDFIAENSDETVRENVEKSLKVENSANKWLKDNKKFLETNSERQMVASKQSEQEESKYHEYSSKSTRKQHRSRIGPSIGKQLPNFGGRPDEVEWSFSDGISEYTQSQGNEDSKYSEDVAFGLKTNSRYNSLKRRPKNSKNRKKKKKTKSKKSRQRRTSARENLNFYRNTHTNTNSSIPDASSISRPHYRNQRRANKSASPSASHQNYSSAENEGGSKMTDMRGSQGSQFWMPSPTAVGKMDYFKTEKGKKFYHDQKNNYKSNRM